MILQIDANSKLLFATAFLPSFLASPLLFLWRTFFPKAVEAIETTSQQVMDSITKNEKLKGILCYLYGDGGLKPSQMSFLHHAAIVHQ
jgi:hypothetical protein